MDKQLRVLIVEDSVYDCDLLERELRKARINFTSKRVETAEEFTAALQNFHPHLILSDYLLPQFTALKAFEILRKHGTKIPCILVTGSQSEEVAVECMKRGADDYILKESLIRLPAAVSNALKKRKAEEDKRKAETALRRSEERYALAAQGANDGLWDWDLQNNAIYFSTRWKAMLGYEDDEIGNLPDEWFALIDPHDLPGVKLQIQSHLDGKIPHLELEHRILHKNGNYRWMLTRGLAIRDDSGTAYRMAGSQTDITGRKATEEKLIQNAFYDSLTGLPNRSLFVQRLETSIARASRRKDFVFAVLFLDLDRFKNVNDSLGHSIGDKLLIAVSRRLESCLRTGAMVTRLGGDEFAILLDDVRTLDDATRVADRIQRELSLPFNISGQEIFSSASIGITLSEPGENKVEDLLRDADTAMYRAKSLGKARYETFEKKMHRRAVALMQTEADFRKAIENEQFRLEYQPIVSLTSGAITAVEALIRWEHPQRGVIQPLEFIPLAEETGLIVPLATWMLQSACRHNISLEQKGIHTRVAVKFLARHLNEEDLAALIEKVLKTTGLNPAKLEIELTGTNLDDYSESAAARLRILKDLGIVLSIDDFGNTYDSLQYLKRLPVDILRIKRSYVRGIATNAKDEAIVTAAITLAHSLGLHVVAEGVETIDQLEILRMLACDEVSGYYIARPVPQEKLKDLSGLTRTAKIEKAVS